MPIPRCVFCLSFLALLLAPALLIAQAPAWQPLGPYGGSVFTLTAAPQRGVLYATAGTAGVLKSTDRGASWRNVLAVDAEGNVAVDPVQPSVLYAVANPGTVWKSEDGGAHWAPSGRGVQGPVQSVTVDPAQRSRVYLASSLGVWRSLNGGASWRRANAGLPVIVPQVTALLAVRSPAGTAFAGTFQGLYRTTDGAGSWSLLSRGLPAARVATLAASETDPRTVYVLFHGPGLYRSTDGGISWRPAVRPPSGPWVLTSLAADPRSSSTLYASLSNGDLLRTVDGARSWAVIGKVPGTDPVDLTPDPFATRILYVGLGFTSPNPGVFRSDDGGATWQGRSQGYPGYQTSTVSVAPHEPEEVWTATANQVFRSGNGGRLWTRVAKPAAPLQTVPSVLAAASGSLAFALTFMFSPTETLVWRTEDAGAAWQPVSSAAVAVLRLAPSEVSTLYALEYSSGPGGGVDVLRSADGGDSWETRATSLGLECGAVDLAVAPSTSAVLYATGAVALPAASCEAPAARVLRSRDGGVTWTDVSAGLPPGLIGRASVDPNDPDVLYVGYGQYFSTPVDGVWKSVDGGATWKRAGTGFAGQPVAALLATSAPGRVYAALPRGRIFCSEDGGESWQDVTANLTALAVNELAASLKNPDRIYAATTNGAWVLEDTP